MVIRRGDIYYADLRPVIGSEQGGVRPVLIIQNDIGNRHSPTVICAANADIDYLTTPFASFLYAGRDYFDEQGKAAYPCGTGYQTVRYDQRFCDPAGAAAYH